YRSLLANADRPDAGSMNKTEKRLIRMLIANLSDQVLKQNGLKDAPLQQVIDLVWAHPQVVSELGELVHALDDAPNHLQHPALSDVRLQVHARYTRIEILAAVGETDRAKIPEWRGGVYDAASA